MHDLTAARTVGLIDALTSNNVMTFADKSYQGAGIRALGERTIATLKTWKLLSKLRCCSHRTTPILQAILVLQAVEDDRYSR